jgi:hypothetical protein
MAQKIKIKKIKNFKITLSAKDETLDDDLVRVEFPFGKFLLHPDVWKLMKETRDERDELRERLDNLLGRQN